jgi:hypothetical protein
VPALQQRAHERIRWHVAFLPQNRRLQQDQSLADFHNTKCSGSGCEVSAVDNYDSHNRAITTHHWSHRTQAIYSTT